MEYAIGFALALGTAAFARVAGFDRDRAFYPTVAIVVASYYVLFGAMSGSGSAVLADAAIAIGFAALAVTGFRRGHWWVVLALAGHGALDAVHPHVVANAGVPTWWPAFCAAFDLTAAAALAFSVGAASRRRGVSTPSFIAQEIRIRFFQGAEHRREGGNDEAHVYLLCASSHAVAARAAGRGAPQPGDLR